MRRAFRSFLYATGLDVTVAWLLHRIADLLDAITRRLRQ